MRAIGGAQPELHLRLLPGWITEGLVTHSRLVFPRVSSNSIELKGARTAWATGSQSVPADFPWAPQHFVSHPFRVCPPTRARYQPDWIPVIISEGFADENQIIDSD